LDHKIHLKNEEQEVKQVLPRGAFQWEEGENGHKESVNKGEYGGCILYSYVKIEE
jgi:hypothetical protein